MEQNLKKLTFKEYLETKDRLRESIQITPQQTTTYLVNTYCKMVVGEAKENK